MGDVESDSGLFSLSLTQPLRELYLNADSLGFNFDKREEIRGRYRMKSPRNRGGRKYDWKWVMKSFSIGNY